MRLIDADALMEELEEKSFSMLSHEQIEEIEYPPCFCEKLYDVVKLDDVKEIVDELAVDTSTNTSSGWIPGDNEVSMKEGAE
jgi:hypothetical protein